MPRGNGHIVEEVQGTYELTPEEEARFAANYHDYFDVPGDTPVVVEGNDDQDPHSFMQELAMLELPDDPELEPGDDGAFADYADAEHAATEWMNARFALVGEGGKMLCVCYPKKVTAAMLRRPMGVVAYDLAGLRLLYKNRPLYYWKQISDNQRVIVSADRVEMWLRARRRRTHSMITVAKNLRRGSLALNLWAGYGVVPRAGKWDKLKRLLLDGICAGNEKDYNGLIKLLAWKAQNPELRTEVALVLRGPKGTGKNTIASIYKYILGNAYCFETAHPEQIFGRFNSHLAHRLVLVLNESFFHGNRKEEAVLKALITEPSFPTERKFGGVVDNQNRALLIMLANAQWVVPATEGERRFYVLDVAKTFARDTAFFGQLLAEMNGGGYEAFLHHLLNTSLGNWHPRDLHDTDGLLAQKMEGLGPVEHWLLALLRDHEGTWPSLDPALNRREVAALKPVGQRDDGTRYLTAPLEWDSESKNELCLGTASNAHKAFLSWYDLNRETLRFREPPGTLDGFAKKLRDLLDDGGALYAWRTPPATAVLVLARRDYVRAALERKLGGRFGVMLRTVVEPTAEARVTDLTDPEA